MNTTMKNLIPSGVLIIGALGVSPVLADTEAPDDHPAGGLDFRLDLGGAVDHPVALGALMQDPPDEEDVAAAAAPEWKIDVQPYIWIPSSIKGNSTVSGSTAKLDLTFGDILDDFDDIFALTGRVEAWKGDWAIILDGMYVSIESDFDVDPSGSGPPISDIHVDISQAIVDLGLGWRFLDRPLDAAVPDGPRVRLDLIGGLRYQYVKQEISLAPVDLGTSKDWVELMIGARASLHVSEKLTFAVRADASGFGIGSASDLTWNLLIGSSWHFTPTFDLKLGFRILDIDYTNGSGTDEFGLDVRMYGPYIGATFRF